MKIRNKLCFFVIFSLFVISITSFFVNINLDKKVYADGYDVAVNDGMTNTQYNINDTRFRDILLVSSNNLTITVLRDCIVSSTINMSAKATIKSNGNYKIRRSGNFAILNNLADIIIGEENSPNILTFDGSNFQQTILKHSGNNKITIYNLNIVGNGNSDVTFDNPNDFGAFVNEGNAIVHDISIHNCYAKMGSAILNKATLNLKKAKIYSNKCDKGTLANIGANADFTIGSGNVGSNIKIYNNVAYKAGAGIYNGELGNISTMNISDCEIYNNVVENNGTAYGGAIYNNSNIYLVYANIHDNQTKCTMKNGSALSAGAGIYNAGNENQFSQLFVYNESPISLNKSFVYDENNIKINEKSETVNSFGAGIANFGLLTLNHTNILNNQSIEGADLWFGTNNVNKNVMSAIKTDNNNYVRVGDIFINSLENKFLISHVDDVEDLSINNIYLNENITAGSTIIYHENSTKNVLKTILSPTSEKFGYEFVEEDRIIVKYLLTFSTKISGNATFGEVITAGITNIKANGENKDDDFVNVLDGDVINYTWYYYKNGSTTKTILSTDDQFEIGAGLNGVVIYVTAELIKTGFVCECKTDASTNPIDKKPLVAVWGSNSINWNTALSAFVFASMPQNPIILAFDIDVEQSEFSKIQYEIFDSENQKIDEARFVGEYTIVATTNSDFEIENDTFSFSITRKVVKLPVVKETDLKFNFGLQQLEYEEMDPIVDIVGDSASKVGEYYAVFELKDIDNYIWENGQIENVVIKWTISWIIHPIYFGILAIMIAIVSTITIIFKIKKKQKMKRKREGVNIAAINEFNSKR